MKSSLEDLNLLFISEMVLDQLGIHHYRQRYTFFALLGDTGGILEISMIFFGMFLYPISKHSFVLTAAKKLYMVRTTCDNLFNQLEDKE